MQFTDALREPAGIFGSTHEPRPRLAVDARALPIKGGDDGLSARVAQLRAYGNAIDPWVAAQFIADAG